MKLILTIEASPAALSAALLAIGQHATANGESFDVSAAPGGPLPGPGPISPLPMPSAPPMPMPAAGGGDDDGPPNAAAPAYDSSGLPWDERIHAKSKATVGDGTWRKRRGVDDATVAAVEAELRSRLGQAGTPQPAPMPQPMPQPAPVAAVAPPMPLPQPVAPPMPPPMPMPQPEPAAPVYAGAGAAMQPPPQPAAPVIPTPEPVHGQLDMAQFMAHLSSKMGALDANGHPLINTDYLARLTAEISGAFGQQLSAITDITSNPQMITFAMQAMQRDGRW